MADRTTPASVDDLRRLLGLDETSGSGPGQHPSLPEDVNEQLQTMLDAKDEASRDAKVRLLAAFGASSFFAYQTLCVSLDPSERVKLFRLDNELARHAKLAFARFMRERPIETERLWKSNLVTLDACLEMLGAKPQQTVVLPDEEQRARARKTLGPLEELKAYREVVIQQLREIQLRRSFVRFAYDVRLAVDALRSFIMVLEMQPVHPESKASYQPCTLIPGWLEQVHDILVEHERTAPERVIGEWTRFTEATTEFLAVKMKLEIPMSSDVWWSCEFGVNRRGGRDLCDQDIIEEGSAMVVCEKCRCVRYCSEEHRALDVDAHGPFCYEPGW